MNILSQRMLVLALCEIIIIIIQKNLSVKKKINFSRWMDIKSKCMCACMRACACVCVRCKLNSPFSALCHALTVVFVKMQWICSYCVTIHYTRSPCKQFDLFLCAQRVFDYTSKNTHIHTQKSPMLTVQGHFLHPSHCLTSFTLLISLHGFAEYWC